MDFDATKDVLDKVFPPAAALAFTSVIALFIGIYTEKFKKRLVYLTHRIYYFPMGTTSLNQYWGNIQVIYNGSPVQHLSFATVHLTNPSNQDLVHIIPEISVGPYDRILGYSGTYDENGKAILLEHNFYSGQTETIKMNAEDLEAAKANPEHVTPQHLINVVNYYLTNKKFYLPVLNRRTSVTLNLLIENTQSEVPTARCSILHQSTKLIEEADETEEKKRINLVTASVGATIFLTTWYFVSQFALEVISVNILGIIGVLALPVGYGCYRLFRMIRRFFL